MTTAERVLERIEAAGGVLALEGQHIRCRLPVAARDLIDDLRVHKGKVLTLLRRRNEIPPMPPGVRLVQWNLKELPVCLEVYSIVTDPTKFARSTLGQIQRLLENPRAKIGWSMPQLIDRLAQVGVIVALEPREPNERSKRRYY
jgi:hypothetical protein